MDGASEPVLSDGRARPAIARSACGSGTSPHLRRSAARRRPPAAPSATGGSL